MDIKLSIIIPIYKEYEVIVVSDGASDLAISKILNYENKFINFKLIKNSHKGAGAVRNLGNNAATGEYVSFIDADDKLSCGFLKKCNELLVKNKDLYIYLVLRELKVKK